MPIRRNRRARVKAAEQQIYDPFDLALCPEPTIEQRAEKELASEVRNMATIREIEQHNRTFAADQPATLHAAFDDINYISRRDADKWLAKSFEVCARWHAREKREELAARYLQRAFIVNQILSEKEKRETVQP